MRKLHFGAGVALIATVAAAALVADVDNQVEFRCYDATRGVTHGGWVSHYSTAAAYCERAQQEYPNNVLYIEERSY